MLQAGRRAYYSMSVIIWMELSMLTRWFQERLEQYKTSTYPLLLGAPSLVPASTWFSNWTFPLKYLEVSKSIVMGLHINELFYASGWRPLDMNILYSQMSRKLTLLDNVSNSRWIMLMASSNCNCYFLVFNEIGIEIHFQYKPVLPVSWVSSRTS